MSKFKICKSRFVNECRDIIRNTSEANIVAHKNKPESYKLSDESKQKLRDKRLSFMMEHPEQTAWRKRNEMSYPEKLCFNILKELELDKKYYIEREYSVFPFYIDFAFVDIKVAIEVDGSFHWRNEERKEKDLQKDKLLKSLGWRILRIQEDELKQHYNDIKTTVLNFIGNSDIEYSVVGIYKITKYEYNKQKKIENQQKKIEDEYETIRIIKESDVDLSKRGWKNIIHHKYNISIKRINRLEKKYPEEFVKCYNNPTENSQQNTKWVTKDNRNKKIHISELDNYIKNGWVLGRCFESNHTFKK